MTVTRHDDANGPSIMTITFTAPQPAVGSAADATPATTTAKPPAKIDMKNKVESEILQELMKLAGGTEVAPTEVELEEKRELEEAAERGQRDRERSLAVRRERKKEEEMLRQARGVA
jgi:large subunit ribosomal protein MRP49